MALAQRCGYTYGSRGHAFLFKKKDTEILEKVQKEPQKLSESRSEEFSENHRFSWSEWWAVIQSQIVEKRLVLKDCVTKRERKPMARGCN